MGAPRIHFNAKAVIRFNTAGAVRMCGWMCHQANTCSHRDARGMVVSTGPGNALAIVRTRWRKGKSARSKTSHETCPFFGVVGSVVEHMKKPLFECTVLIAKSFG